MADVADHSLVEEEAESDEDVSEDPGGAKLEAKDTQMTKGERVKGGDTSGAVCAACRRVFTLTKTGLVRTHGPVGSRCSGSRAPPASSIDVPQPPSNAPTASSVPPDPGEAEDPQRLDLHLRHSTKILKRIPRGSREGAAKKLASLVETVVARNDIPSWSRLLHFPVRCLRAPKRGGRRWNMVRDINEQIRSESDPPPAPAHRQAHGKHHDQLETLALRVATKLEEGNFKGAVRLACSEESIADMNDKTLAALQLKHPPPHPDSHLPPPPEDPSLSPSISEEAVVKAIHSFPNGSAGGPDGLSPQHLKDMTGASAQSGGPALLRALTSLTNIILQGKIPRAVCPFFFGASLVALEKKEGGVRPIAVGCTLRRLAAKTASSHIMEAMGALLAPRQLGYGTPHGAEAAVFAARLFLDNLQPNEVILKLDFKNAFNTIRRDKMLKAVRDLAPELTPFVHSAYSEPSILFWGEQTLMSREGVQQGDPLGPLLFCLTIHELISQLESDLRMFYLDDGTLGGSPEVVLRDLQLVEQGGAELGLSLNHKKSEVISHNPITKETLLSATPDLSVTNPDCASLLGSPIGDVKCIDQAIQEKAASLKIMGDRLPYLHAQDALLLLRHSFAIPKLLYTLRTTPCFLSHELKSYDNLLRSITSRIANVSLSDPDPAWIQASLPVKHGGLGIRSAVQLAPSAFLASAAGSSSLVSMIVPTPLQDAPLTGRSEALRLWAQGHDSPPPPDPAAHRQKLWDLPKVCATAQALTNDAPDARSRARLLAASRKESGAWLQALPVSSLGLRMDDETVRVAVGLRLGTPLCRPHECSHCRSEVDHLGTHGLSCRWSEGRHPRHAAVNDIIHRSLSSANIPSRLEPSGLYQSDGKRPDGCSILPWQCGKLLVWDATCPDTFAPSHLPAAVRGAGVVAAQAEQVKVSKYAHLDTTHHFVPFAVETSGVLGEAAENFTRELARRICKATGEPRSRQFLLQRLSIAVQRGNAAAVLGTMGRRQDCWE